MTFPRMLNSILRKTNTISCRGWISSNVPMTSPLTTNNNSTPLRMFSIVPGVGKGKTSTGLVGLAVDHDAIPKIIHYYQLLLDKMAASDMPPSAQYYQNVEKIARYRIQAAKDHPDDPEKVEELCNCGQVEELVKQAQNEMLVLDMYLKNRWWEYVKDVEIEFDAEAAGVDGSHGDVEWDSKLEKKN